MHERARTGEAAGRRREKRRVMAPTPSTRWAAMKTSWRVLTSREGRLLPLPVPFSPQTASGPACGCWTWAAEPGMWLSWPPTWSAPDGSVVGVDQSPQAVARARLRAGHHGLAQVRFIEGDIHDPAPGGPFDAIVERLAQTSAHPHSWTRQEVKGMPSQGDPGQAMGDVRRRPGVIKVARHDGLPRRLGPLPAPRGRGPRSGGARIPPS